MARKLLSFLGTGAYQETTYYKDEVECTTPYIQEALVEYLGKDVEVILFLTKRAEERNFLGEDLQHKALKKILDYKGVNYRPISILDGKSEEEMWQNFDTIYDSLDKGDEIYFDVTHSFRSLPVICTAIINYAKFVKGIHLKGIYYGAFEARSNDKAPIFNLTMFDKIIDWSVGADKFLTSGEGEALANMMDSTIRPILQKQEKKDEGAKSASKITRKMKAFSDDLKTCRGDKLVNSSNELKAAFLELRDTEIHGLKPFQKIVSIIIEKFDNLSGDIVNDTFYIACLCREFSLLQQGFTLLCENFLNLACKITDKNMLALSDRETAKRAFISITENNFDESSHNEEFIQIRNKLLEVMTIEDARNFHDFMDFRNDLNHGGFRENKNKSKVLEKKLDDYIKIFEEIHTRACNI